MTEDNNTEEQKTEQDLPKEQPIDYDKIRDERRWRDMAEANRQKKTDNERQL